MNRPPAATVAIPPATQSPPPPAFVADRAPTPRTRRTVVNLRPRFDWGGWYGAALTGDPGNLDDADGWCLCIQWLGMIIEIGTGRVKR